MEHPKIALEPQYREVLDLSVRIFKQQCEQLNAIRLGNRESELALSDAIDELREQLPPEREEILNDTERQFLARQIHGETYVLDTIEGDVFEAAEADFQSEDEHENDSALTLQAINERTEKIEKILSQYVEESRKSEKIISHLEGEVRRFKTREDERKHTAMILEIVMIKDRLDEITNHFLVEKKPAPQFKELYQAIELVNGSTAEVLLKQGVTQISPEVGGKYDSTSQEVENVLESELADEDLDIVRVTRTGYMLADNVIRPALVNIKKYVAAAAV